jgi:hypothetical protein
MAATTPISATAMPATYNTSVLTSPRSPATARDWSQA